MFASFYHVLPQLFPRFNHFFNNRLLVVIPLVIFYWSGQKLPPNSGEKPLVWVWLVAYLKVGLRFSLKNDSVHNKCSQKIVLIRSCVFREMKMVFCLERAEFFSEPPPCGEILRVLNWISNVKAGCWLAEELIRIEVELEEEDWLHQDIPHLQHAGRI